MQVHAKVRCGICQERFDSVAQLLEHKQVCETGRVTRRLAPAMTIPTRPADPQPAHHEAGPTGETDNGESTPVGDLAAGSEKRGSAVRRLTATVPCRKRFTAGMVMTRPVVTVRDEATLWTAWGLLHGADYRHLVVVDAHRRPVGVLDEQTITREWPHGPIAPHRQRVHDLTLGQPLPHVGRDDAMSTVARVMLRADADAAAVVDEAGGLLGLVTTRHLSELVAECA